MRRARGELHVRLVSLNLVRRRQIVPMPSKRQLRKGARHANYEMSMLHVTAVLLLNGVSPPLYRPVLESWAAHLRNLIEFFYPTSATRADTVRAEWYVTDPAAWKRKLPVLNKAERKRRLALHKHLAHISYERDGRKTRWSTRDHEIVMRRLRLFKENLSTKRRRWFPDVLP